MFADLVNIIFSETDMYEDIKMFGLATVIVVIIFSTFLVPLFRKILKAFDNIINQKEVLFQIKLMMEQLSSNLAGTTNCTKQQLYGVLQLYFNNMTNELYNFVIETRATSNLLNNKSLLNSMIVNSFEQILQDNNTQIDYFKYNSKNISNILSYYIDKNTITQLLLNLIEQTDITNHQIKTILDNTFIPLLNNNFKP